MAVLARLAGCDMRMTMRWYGTDDPVSLEYIRQVPVVQGIVTALYDVPVGQVWPQARLRGLQTLVEAEGLTLDVIESIAIHDAIKLGLPERDRYIDAYCQSIRHMAALGIGVLCYNFMPVFDWMRTNLAMPLDDGSTALSFHQADFDRFDLDSETIGLPGWSMVYTPAELRDLLEQYQALSADDLFANLVYFLEAVTPIAREVGVKLAIHPDDPPWSIFGIPRIVSTAADVARLLAAVPDAHNGITFCSGSFGARADNDLTDIIAQFSDRIHFVHLRSVKRTDERDFHEVAHNHGDVIMRDVVAALVANQVDAPVRPDHGRMIWGETGRAGYGLYDRALGAMYLAGLCDALQRK